MQTFMTYVDPPLTAMSLDNKRLGKQRVEGKQIIDLLEGRVHNGWRNHPAVRMWEGYLVFLKNYVNTMIDAWVHRGCENTMEKYDWEGPIEIPWWCYDPRSQYSHRANLVRKFPEHYREKWPNVFEETPYWWPVELKTKSKQDYLNEFWSQYDCLRIDGEIELVEVNYGQNYSSWHSDFYRR